MNNEATGALSVPAKVSDVASPFHQGERIAQERAGVVMQADAGARVIRDYMPDQHRTFFSALPFIILGGLDDNGQPWATVRAGRPGFITSANNRTLTLDGGVLPGDPVADHMKVGTPVGGIGIQPHTRRRNRVNGVITQIDGGAMTIGVQQSFGNCPKYITTREAIFTPRGSSVGQITHTDALTEDDRRLISAADTFFIASANLDITAGSARGVDVSHRGGAPGFVEIASDGTLIVADYSGNNFFNTIGNLISNPRAGLLFVDFESGDLLYLATHASVVWGASTPTEVHARPAVAASSTDRWVHYRVEQVRRVRDVLPLRWKAVTLDR